MNGPSSESHEPVVAGERFADTRRIDGNAAAGILSEVFVPDLTAARAKCAGCGVTRAIGTLIVYAHGMGMVVRCPGCDRVMLRLARTPTHVWLDSTGSTSIVISRDAS
jgi:ribosomal protein S27E